MSRYIDGFVLPIAKDQLETYRDIASRAGAIWKEHGALEYVECRGDDFEAGDMISFPAMAGATDGQTVVFAWIAFKSRAHRDEVNAKVMADPRMKDICPAQDGPDFDYKRMAYGGFETIVEL